MKNNIISYGEYRKRLNSMTTPEEVATFAQELITPIMRDLQPVAEGTSREEIPENIGNHGITTEN